MRHSGVIVFIAVCASAIPSSRSQDFSSCRNLSTDITGCSTEFLQGISTNGLFTDFTKGFNLTSAISGSFCQSSTKTAILDFYGCIYEKLLACLSSDWQKVLPSLDQRKQSFDYMCDNINDVDLTCVGTTGNAGALLNCLKQGTKGGFNLSTPDGYLAFVCSRCCFRAVVCCFLMWASMLTMSMNTTAYHKTVQMKCLGQFKQAVQDALQKQHNQDAIAGAPDPLYKTQDQFKAFSCSGRSKHIRAGIEDGFSRESTAFLRLNGFTFKDLTSDIDPQQYDGSNASQLYESCTKTAYGSCPKRTAEVLVEIDKLTRPAGCDACVSQPSLLLLASVLAFMMALFK